MTLTQSSYAIDSLETVLVVERAAKCVTGICRVDNYSTRSQYLDDLIDQALLRRLRVYFEVLGHNCQAEADVSKGGVSGQRAERHSTSPEAAMR